jgi:predicted O-methyltransferase YrrM
MKIGSFSSLAKEIIRRGLRTGGFELRRIETGSLVDLQSLDISSGLGDSAWLLFGLVRSMKPTTCVEIGSARGKSACFIGAALRENQSGTLYAIDPHCLTSWNDTESIDTYEIMLQNLQRAGVTDYVEIIRQTSDLVAQNWQLPIDMIFIDGDHSYEGVKRDWEYFSRFVQPFGVVVFHDTLWDLKPDHRYRSDMGVPRFVDELRQSGYPVTTLDKDFGVSIAQPAKQGVPLRGSSS